jgi:hypothetical protein
MKRLLLVFILTLNFQSLTKADDIKDFQIEGMSIGDSLLNFFNNEEILKSIVDWYDDLEKNRFTSLAFESSNFNQYDFVDVWTKHGDKNFIIVAIAGVNYFGNNDLILDIDDCYIKQLQIAKDIESLFVNSKMDGPHTLTHTTDPSGNSTYTDIYFDLNSQYEAVIGCYDWNENLDDKADHIYITLRSKNFATWLD